MSSELESQIAKLALAVSRKKKNDPDLIALRKQIEKQLPKSVSITQLKKWIPRVVKSLSTVNLEEEARKSGRENKEWRHPPVNYAPLASNMQDRNIDVGEVIYDEIYIHGRQTPDELLKHLGGIEPQMVVMIYLSMLADNYLMWHTEANRQKTLELVELSEEEKAARKRHVLEDAKAKKNEAKSTKRRARRNVLEKIRVVDAPTFSTPKKGKKKPKIKFIDNTEDELIDDMNQLMKGPSPNQRRMFQTG